MSTHYPTKIFLAAAFMHLPSCGKNRYTSGIEAIATNQSPSYISKPQRVTAGLESNFGNHLSANGAFVAFTSDRLGSKDIWEKNTGSGYPRQLTDHPADDYGAAYSPDGKYVAYVSRQADAQGDVHVVETGFTFTQEDNHFSLKNSEESSPSWFPDSRRVIFASREPGQAESRIYIGEIDEWKVEVLADLRGTHPQVSPDGKYVAYSRRGDLWLYEFSRDKSYRLTSSNELQDGFPSFSADGGSILFSRYGFDTNGDKRIDGDDNAAIWRLRIEDKLGKKEADLENFSMEPLTSPSFAALYPKETVGEVFFTMLEEGSLDIFRLPIHGQLEGIKDERHLNVLLDRYPGLLDRLFIIHRAQFDRRAEPNGKLLRMLVATEMDIYVKVGNANLARWLYAKAKRKFKDQTDFLQLLEVLTIEAELNPLIEKGITSGLSIDENRLMNKSQKRLRRYCGDSNSLETKARALLLQAKILWTMGEREDSTKEVTNLLDQDEHGKNFHVGIAWEFYVRQRSVVGGLISAGSAAVKAAQRYRLIPVIQKRIAEQFLKEALGKNEYFQVVQEILRQSDLPPDFSAMLHGSLIDALINRGNDVVASNELVSFIKNYSNKPNLVVPALEKRIALLEKMGNEVEAKKILDESISSYYDPRVTILREEFLIRYAEKRKLAGDLGTAKNIYFDVLKAGTENLDAHRGIVDVTIALGHFEDAFNDYKNKYKNRPTNPFNSLMLGYLHLIKEENEDLEPKARLSKLKEAIDLLEDSRSRDASNAMVHEFLGIAYERMESRTQDYYKSDTFGSRLSKNWGLVADYFGFGEPRWGEQALDSYLSSFALSKNHRLTRSGLALKLGRSFYVLENYSRALQFLMERIRAEDDAPFPSAFEQIRTYQQAASAAFYLDDFVVASSVQRRLVTIFETLNNLEGRCEALDKLALYLRVGKSFKEAEEVYQELLDLQIRFKMNKNITKTYINLAGVLNELQEYRESIHMLNRVVGRLKVMKTQSGAETDAIALDLAGDSSDAKGFDDVTNAILIESLFVEAFEGLENLYEAYSHQRRKIALMKLKQQGGLDSGRGESYYVQELSVAYNVLGNIAYQRGNYADAIEKLGLSIDFGQRMRPEGRNYPTQQEWVSMEGIATIAGFLSDSKMLDSDLAHQLSVSLEAYATALSSESAKSDRATYEPYSHVLLMRGKLRKFLEDKSEVPEARRSYELASSGNYGAGVRQALMTNPFHVEKREQWPFEAALRKSMLSDEDDDWKYHVRGRRFQLAFNLIAERILSGFSFAGPWDRYLLDHTFFMLSREYDDPSAYGLYRKFLAISLRELANSNGITEVNLDVKNDDQLARALVSAAGILSIHLDGSGLGVVFRHTSQKLVREAIDLRGLSEAEVAKAIAKIIKNCSSSIGYLTLSGQVDLNWESVRVAAAEREIAFIASPDLLVHHLEVAKAPKSSLIEIGGKKLKEKIGRYLYSTSEWPLQRQKSNMFHFRYLVAANHAQAGSSSVRLDQQGYQPLGAVFEGIGRNYSFGMLRSIKHEPVWGKRVDFWRYLELLALKQGIGTILVVEKPDKNQVIKFYENSSRSSFAAANRDSGLGGLLLGFRGYSEPQLRSMAQSRFSQSILDGIQEVRDGKLSTAIESYSEAAFFAQYLGELSQHERAIGSLVDTLSNSGDARSALFFQEGLLEEYRNAGDAVRLKSALVTAGVLALEAGMNERASMHVREYEAVGGDKHTYQYLSLQTQILVGKQKWSNALENIEQLTSNPQAGISELAFAADILSRNAKLQKKAGHMFYRALRHPNFDVDRIRLIGSYARSMENAGLAKEAVGNLGVLSDERRISTRRIIDELAVVGAFEVLLHFGNENFSQLSRLERSWVLHSKGLWQGSLDALDDSQDDEQKQFLVGLNRMHMGAFDLAEEAFSKVSVSSRFERPSKVYATICRAMASGGADFILPFDDAIVSKALSHNFYLKLQSLIWQSRHARSLGRRTLARDFARKALELSEQLGGDRFRWVARYELAMAQEPDNVQVRNQLLRESVAHFLVDSRLDSEYVSRYVAAVLAAKSISVQDRLALVESHTSQRSFSTPDFVDKVPAESLWVRFYVSSDLLYRWIISNEGVRESVSSATALVSAADALKNTLVTRSVIEQPLDKVAGILFSGLREMEKKQVIIVPHGMLETLPFDLLLYKKPIDYRLSRSLLLSVDSIQSRRFSFPALDTGRERLNEALARLASYSGTGEERTPVAFVFGQNDFQRTRNQFEVKFGRKLSFQNLERKSPYYELERVGVGEDVYQIIRFKRMGRYLNSGLNVSEAYRKALASVAESGTHPGDWAGLNLYINGVEP